MAKQVSDKSFFTLAQPVDKESKSVRLVKEGNYFYGDEPLDLSHEVLANIVKNFKSGKKPEKPTKLAINYNHGMRFSSGAEDGIAAGWIETVTLSDDGWLEITPSWVPRAQAYIENREYQYLSAEIVSDYRSKKNRKSMGPVLIGAALTNIPFIEGQEGLTLSERQPEDSMDELKELQDQFDAKIVELAEVTATRDTVTAEKLTLSAEFADVSTKLSDATAKIVTLETDITTANDARVVAESRIVELATDIRGKEADAFITKNLSEGRLTPGEGEAYRTAYLSNKEIVEALMVLRPVITLKEIGNDDATDFVWVLADEVAKYQVEHPKATFSDASIAVTRLHSNKTESGGK